MTRGTERLEQTSDQSESANASGRYEASSSGADRFLGLLFLMAEYAPRVLRFMSWALGRIVWAVAPGVRSAVLDNLSRVCPKDVLPKARQRIGQRVVSNFICFVADLGLSQKSTAEQLLARATEIEGAEHYERALAMGRGVVIATAHLGSFEVGLAVAASKASAVHVVFATDPFPRFDRMRQHLREKLGVHESRAEGGWMMWSELRDALERDEVVVLQADRVMPGQKGDKVALLGEPAVLPTGPVRLAQMTGAPIVPIFSVRSARGRIRILIDEPILVDDSSDLKAAQRDALEKLASVIGRRVQAYPDQWLMLQRVWENDG